MIPSLSTVLNSAIRSMQVAQFGLGINSQNIAHANDPNYTRQTIDPRAGTDAGRPVIQRLRDAFVDSQYRLSIAAHGEASMRQDILSRVEDIVGDPVGGGLGTSLNELFDSWKGLAENPADGVSRLEVLSAGSSFVTQVKLAYNQLSALKDEVNEQLVTKTSQVNDDLNKIFDLNKQIMEMHRNNLADGSLRDQRDALLDDLSNLTGAISTEQADGSVRVIVGSTVVMDGPTLLQMQVTENASHNMDLNWTGFSTVRYSGAGEMRGLVDVRDNDLTELMADINNLAKTVAGQVNHFHGESGIPGDTAQVFFSVGVGPVDIEVNRNLAPADVLPGYDPTAPADGERARAIANLATAPVMNSILLPDQTQSFTAYYRNVIGLIGNRAADANQAADIAKVHTDAADRQRQSEWGVSLDEEMGRLMLQQKSFAAAARVITNIDTMFDFLINHTGT